MTMVSCTNKFIRANKTWLTDDHAPAVAALKVLAKMSDEDPRASTLSSYGLTYRALLALKSAADPDGPDDSDLE